MGDILSVLFRDVACFSMTSIGTHWDAPSKRSNNVGSYPGCQQNVGAQETFVRIYRRPYLFSLIQRRCCFKGTGGKGRVATVVP